MKRGTSTKVVLLSALLALIHVSCGESGYQTMGESGYETVPGESAFTAISGTLDLATAGSEAGAMAEVRGTEKKVYVVAMDLEENEILAEVSPDGTFVLNGVRKNQPYLLYFYDEDENGERTYIAVLALDNEDGESWCRFVKVPSHSLDLALINLLENEDGVMVAVPENPPELPPLDSDEVVDEGLTEPPELMEENRIIMPLAGILSFSLESAEARLISDLYLTAPFERNLIDDREPEEYTLHRMVKAGQEVELAIEVDGSPMGLGTYRHSSLSGYAVVTQVSDTEWRIEFEDLPFYLTDWDFDDMVITMTLTPAVITEIEVGKYHTCALLADGRVKCWGNNEFGQLGDATGVSSPDIPVTVYGLSDAVALDCGYRHCCIVNSGGWVQCWGANSNGELGNNTEAKSLYPQPALWVEGAVDIACGHFHTCAVIADGSVECWGGNNYGELGSWASRNYASQWEEPDLEAHTALPVPDIDNAVGIEAGEYHTCALLSDGSVKCWGNNKGGQLGVYSCDECTVPPFCEILPDGKITCRQYTGINYCEDQCATPSLVSGLENVSELGLGDDHTCAVLSSGSVKCWGQNFIGSYYPLGHKGMLGDGTDQDSTTPVLVYGDPDGLAVAARNNRTCMIESGGSMQCWGGWGSSEDLLFPAPMPDIESAVALDMFSGINSLCVLLLDGTVKCWTSNGIIEPPLDGN